MRTFRFRTHGATGHTGSCHANCICNARGDDDDRRQIVADLISNDASPFLPDDEDSLRMMSDATLRKMRDQYAVSTNEEVDDEDRLTTIKQMVTNSIAKHVGGDLKLIQGTLRTRPSSVQADDDEVRAMTVHAFHAMNARKLMPEGATGRDVVAEAQARRLRNLEALESGILPNILGMRVMHGEDVVALDDDEAEAMITSSTLSCFHAMKGR